MRNFSLQANPVEQKPRIEVETYIWMSVRRMSWEPYLKTYDILVTERLPDTSEVNLLEDFEGLGVDAVQATLKGLGDKYPDAIFYDVTSFLPDS